jgi:hypothetical protein
VEDPELCQSRRLLGLSPVTLEPPPPPLRWKLDQQGSFEATGLQTFVPEQLLKESIILNLEVAAFGSIETPTTDILAPFIVPIQFHDVGENHKMIFLICLEELHSLESPTSFVLQLQLEGGSNPLVSQATT